MSDADWDMEYDKANELEQEIIDFCKHKGIDCPIIKPYARSWELKKILKNLKS